MALAIAISPLYLWQSGLPQIGHAIAALPAALLFFRAKPWRFKPHLFGLAFAAYAVVVNLVVFALYRDTKTLLSAFYYPFNFLVWNATVWTLVDQNGQAHTKKFLLLLRLALWLFLLMETAMVTTGWYTGWKAQRPTGTFNDPNQLSHWVVWTVVVITSEAWLNRRSLVDGFAALVAGSICVFYAASRSGAIGMATAILGYGFLAASSLRFAAALTRIYAIVAVAAATLIVTAAAYDSIRSVLADVPLNALARLQETDWRLELEKRGYDRLYKYPFLCITGAGEGAEWRWYMRCWFTGEIHSTPANLLFSYGLPGSLFFLLFWLKQWLRLPGPGLKIMAIAPLVYSLGTYSLRNWTLWIGMGLLYGLARFAEDRYHPLCDCSAAASPKRPNLLKARVGQSPPLGLQA
ncbi:hypothetical protein ACPDIX_00040 [Limisphaera sp. 4302-co]